MERHYKITLESNINSGEPGANSAFAKNSTQSSTQQAHQQKAGAGITKGNLKLMGAYHTVKSFAVQQINHEVSLVELRTGSKDAQDHASFYNNLVQTGLGIAESVAVGAYVGSLPGAIAGLLLSTGHKVLSYANANETLQIQRQIENRSLHAQYIRAGAQGSRSERQ